MADSIERKEYPKEQLFDSLVDMNEIWVDSEQLDELVDESDTRDAFVYDTLEWLSDFEEYSVEKRAKGSVFYDASGFDEEDAERAKSQFEYE